VEHGSTAGLRALSCAWPMTQQANDEVRAAHPAVDFIYDDDCPNVDAARANLKAACVARGLSASWAEHRIGDPAVPDRARGFGSPTILVDGRDVAGARPEAEHCCRVYSTGGGVPSVELIAAALEKATQGETSP